MYFIRLTEKRFKNTEINPREQSCREHEGYQEYYDYTEFPEYKGCVEKTPIQSLIPSLLSWGEFISMPEYGESIGTGEV